jgi:hypothetical protein
MRRNEYLQMDLLGRVAKLQGLEVLLHELVDGVYEENDLCKAPVIERGSRVTSTPYLMILVRIESR